MNKKYEACGTAVISSSVALEVIKAVGFNGFAIYRRDRKNGFGMQYALQHARGLLRDKLTHEQRGDGINKAAELLAAKSLAASDLSGSEK